MEPTGRFPKPNSKLLEQRKDDDLVVEQQEDGGLAVEFPDDIVGWLQRKAGYATVRLGKVEGAEFPSAGGTSFFMWRDGEEADALPWAEAVQRFGPLLKS